jgi:hypothetical protein
LLKRVKDVLFQEDMNNASSNSKSIKGQQSKHSLRGARKIPKNDRLMISVALIHEEQMMPMIDEENEIESHIFDRDITE